MPAIAQIMNKWGTNVASKKFWVAIGTMGAIATLEPERAITVAIVGSVYLVVQGVVDAVTGKNSNGDQ